MTPNHYLISPNAFKESLPAPKVAQAMEEGIRQASPEAEITLLPLADGGDGSLEVLELNVGLERISLTSVDVLGREIECGYGMGKNREAFIEMAGTSGLRLVEKDNRDVMKADSGGTGICMRDAFSRNADQIILMVGGTANMDGGHGILRELGFRFIDDQGHDIQKGAGDLHRLETIIPPDNLDRLRKTPVTILTDVEHTISGPQSCARVFAPQKGAGKKEIERIDHALDHLSRVAEKQTGINVRKLKGGGAAGGTPAGLYPWLNVSIRSGAAEIMKISGFSEHASRAGVIFTGEGKLDQQSLGGKLPVIIARKAKETGSKVIFIGGRIPENTLAFDSLFEGIFSITPGPCSLEESMENSYDWVKNTSYRIAKLLSLT